MRYGTKRNPGIWGALFMTFGALALSACGDSTGPGGGGGGGGEVPELPEVPPGTVVFQDDIDAENGGVGMPNYTGWADWSVTEGCVDLHGPNSTNPLPGNGVYMDLDGTCSNAGTIETKETYDLPAGDYTLEFVMAGNNQQDQTDTLTMSVGSVFSREVTLPYTEPFKVRAYDFTVGTATTGKVILAHNGGDDQGILIDAVRLRRR